MCMFQTEFDQTTCIKFGPPGLCDQALVMTFEVFLGLGPLGEELHQGGLASNNGVHIEVWVPAHPPSGEVMLVWVEIGHKGLEGHVHLLHGGVVSDAQQFAPTVSLVDVQLAVEVVMDNSVHIPQVTCHCTQHTRVRIGGQVLWFEIKHM